MARALARVFALAVVGSLAVAASAGAQSLASLAEQARAAREQQAPADAAPVVPLRAQQGMVAPETILTVASGTINAGDVITDDMLEERPFSSASAQRYPMAASRSTLVGKVAKRMLVAGNPIPTFAVMEPKLVTRGTAATVIFEEGGLSIRGVAMPLDSGVAGASVRLKNIDSGHVITGIVQADGTVKVGG